jgi:hypothetical protein
MTFPLVEFVRAMAFPSRAGHKSAQNVLQRGYAEAIAGAVISVT